MDLSCDALYEKIVKLIRHLSHNFSASNHVQ